MEKPVASDLLQDMRIVFNSRAMKGENASLIQLREDRKKAPSTWIKEYRAAEKEFRDEVKEWEKWKAKEARENQAIHHSEGLLCSDEGSMKIEELCERLLAEYHQSKVSQ